MLDTYIRVTYQQGYDAMVMAEVREFVKKLQAQGLIKEEKVTTQSSTLRD